MKNHHYCYIIRSNTTCKTYCGYTNLPLRRLRAHNGEIANGAKYTRNGRPWSFVLQVTGFKDKIEALCFEWAMKHTRYRRMSGIKGRLYALNVVLNRDKWTQKCPDAKTRPLKLYWFCKSSYETSRDIVSIPDQVQEIQAFRVGSSV